MLRELHISNFAIIEEQSISFGPGLNVISGETGSGKSIVLQALELILGGRPKPQYLRKGADGWQIEALFSLDSLPESRRETLPDMIEGDELVATRTMNRSGRGKVYLNGRLATVSLLEEAVRAIMNICAQGQHIRLLEPTYHLEVVDGFAGNSDLLASYQEKYQLWRDTRAQLEVAEERIEKNLLRRAELEFLVEELGKSSVQAGKREQLEQQLKRASHAERLVQAGAPLLRTLNDDSGVLEQVAHMQGELQELLRIDGELQSLHELLSSAQAELAEFEKDFDTYLSTVEVNEELLSGIREELAEIARLERKYRTDDAGLVSLLAQAQDELASLDQTANLECLREEVASLYAQVVDISARLSATRRKAGKKLSSLVSSELHELNMKNAQLSVVFKSKEPALDGADSLEIFIVPNKGEDPKPLRQIASGGELSRIMLVLKKILREQSGVNVLIFDEVDSGISGGVARAVGEKLKQLASYSQVVCITHLAQVASLAHHHFLVDKKVGQRTISVIRELGDQDKVEEVARMIAGYDVTETARASARELLAANS